jgi:hypothetical protein
LAYNYYKGPTNPGLGANTGTGEGISVTDKAKIEGLKSIFENNQTDNQPDLTIIEDNVEDEVTTFVEITSPSDNVRPIAAAAPQVTYIVTEAFEMFPEFVEAATPIKVPNFNFFEDQPSAALNVVNSLIIVDPATGLLIDFFAVDVSNCNVGLVNPFVDSSGLDKGGLAQVDFLMSFIINLRVIREEKGPEFFVDYINNSEYNSLIKSPFFKLIFIFYKQCYC